MVLCLPQGLDTSYAANADGKTNMSHAVTLIHGLLNADASLLTSLRFTFRDRVLQRPLNIEGLDHAFGKGQEEHLR